MIAAGDEELAFGAIGSIRATLRSRRITPVELIEAVLARIERDEPKIHAWVEIDAERALAAARDADLDAPLGGIPFGVKDVIDVRGMPTRFGANVPSPPAQFDAWCVAAMRRAGAIPLGKLHTTAFAFQDPAPTRNPWDLTRTPGGSSSGSGAAVGARQIPFAFGTQTGGSTLRPAAYCGVVGFKPTFGAIPTTGVSILAPTFDHVGIIARDAVDATAVYALFDPLAAGVKPPRPVRILQAVGFRDEISGDEVREAVAEALRRLVDVVEVAPAELPAEVGDVEACWHTIASYEVSGALAPLLREQSAGPKIEKLVAEGLEVDVAAYGAARRRHAAIRGAIDALLQRCDVVALPTAGRVPDPATTGSAAFLRPWTFAGVPSISIPIAFDGDGLPIGLQLVAKRGGDAMLLAIARMAQAKLALENPGPRARLERA